MRKAYYVRLSQVKDEQAYSLLLNCRHCIHVQLREYISENRVKSYMKAKLIEKIPTQQGTVYRLTEKGYREFDKSIIHDHYRYHSNSVEHDIALADKYIQTMRDEPYCRWRNEEDLKHDRKEQIEDLREQGRYEDALRLACSSVPDCVITTTSGVSYGFDIVTDNYTAADIQEKIDYCEEMQIDFRSERI